MQAIKWCHFRCPWVTRVTRPGFQASRGFVSYSWAFLLYLVDYFSGECLVTGHFGHTSAPRHFGPAWNTFAQCQLSRHFCAKNVVRDTSTSDLRKVGTLWIQDNSDKTQLHRRLGLKLVPKCFGAEMSCGRSVRLVSRISEVNVYLFSPFGSYSRSDAIC